MFWTIYNKWFIDFSFKINQCKYCNKILSRYDSLSRHMKTCKEKKEVELTMIQNEEMIKIKKETMKNGFYTQKKM